jgi:hypothetical protein
MKDDEANGSQKQSTEVNEGNEESSTYQTLSDRLGTNSPAVRAAHVRRPQHEAHDLCGLRDALP